MLTSQSRSPQLLTDGSAKNTAQSTCFGPRARDGAKRSDVRPGSGVLISTGEETRSGGCLDPCGLQGPVDAATADAEGLGCLCDALPGIEHGDSL